MSLINIQSYNPKDIQLLDIVIKFCIANKSDYLLQNCTELQIYKGYENIGRHFSYSFIVISFLHPLSRAVVRYWRKFVHKY